MKLKYIGESFYNGLGLTNGKIYECVGIDYENRAFDIIDDENDGAYSYAIDDPSAPDGSTGPGKWEIVEDPDGLLEEVLNVDKNIE